MTSLPNNFKTSGFASFELALQSRTNSSGSLVSMSDVSSMGASVDDSAVGSSRRSMTPKHTKSLNEGSSRSRWETGNESSRSTSLASPGTNRTGSTNQPRAPRRQRSNPFLQRAATTQGLVLPRRKQSNPDILGDGMESQHNRPRSNASFPRRVMTDPTSGSSRPCRLKKGQTRPDVGTALELVAVEVTKAQQQLTPTPPKLFSTEEMLSSPFLMPPLSSGTSKDSGDKLCQREREAKTA